MALNEHSLSAQHPLLFSSFINTNIRAFRISSTHLYLLSFHMYLDFHPLLLGYLSLLIYPKVSGYNHFQ